ncbi:MAG TPA: hypothetical protein VK601_16665 [Kofleriaceae bacterium]|nr:hypothetical protein [Kofleriaceae bacterium]
MAAATGAAVIGRGATDPTPSGGCAGGAPCGMNGLAGIGRGGATPGAVTGTAEPAGENWRCGNRASSAIFWVGATRAPDAASRAPQPPQNRESGALSVAQLGQRIP